MNKLVAFFFGMLTAILVGIFALYWTQFVYVDEYTATMLKHGDYEMYWIGFQVIIIVLWSNILVTWVYSMFGRKHKDTKDINISNIE